MLMPKRVKYRKVQRGRMTGVASRGNKVVYGEYGIQAMEPGWITGNQIEAADNDEQNSGEYISAQSQYAPQRPAHAGQHRRLIEPRRHQQPAGQSQQAAEQGGDAHGNERGG